MQIHTVKPGDTIFKIARQHATSPMKIIEHNELENPDRLSVGQKLLIIPPTRTYTARGSDTLDRIADRFGVKKESLYRVNPSLYGTDRIYPGQILTVKHSAPAYGMASANGYFYKGTTPERLSLTLPYLTFLTIAAGKRNGNVIDTLFNPQDAIKAAREGGKIPLLRIYDDYPKQTDAYADNIINMAKKDGYGGVTLAAYRAIKENKNEYANFLMNLKRRLMEENLRLFTELDGNGDTDLADVCDGYVIMYDKCGLTDIPSFKDGENLVMTEFAEHSEPTKAYIELPSLGYMGAEEITVRGAEELAYAAGQEIQYDADKRICHFNYNKYKGGSKEAVRVAYESLENIKAKLDLIYELGFMGAAFDIMKVPISYLIMFDSSFSMPPLYLDM